MSEGDFNINHMRVGPMVHAQLRRVLEDPKSSPALRYKACKLLIHSLELCAEKREKARVLKRAWNKINRSNMSRPSVMAPAHVTELLSKLEQ